MPFPDNNLSTALESLKPAIAPQPLPWWPPAPGWWFVAITLILLLVAIGIFLWRRRQFLRATRYQREAYALLGHVLEKNDTLAQLQEIARIMRRAAISAYGRESAGTQPWPELVRRLETNLSDKKKNHSNTSTTLDAKSLELLGSALYQQHYPTPEEIQHLLQQVNMWLAKLPPHRESKP